MSDRHPRTESELVDFVRSIDERAPESLHRRVESLIAESTQRRRRRLRAAAPRLALGALCACALALAVVLSLGGTHRSTLGLPQTSALTLSPATAPAPAQSAANPTELTTAVEGVGFPYWEDRFGWRSTGLRTDRVGGRTVTTVFYGDAHGHRIGYAIVAGTPPPVSGGVVTWRGSTAYRELSEQGVAVVTWLRDGRLCVMAGRGVDAATLLALASWDGQGSVPS